MLKKDYVLGEMWNIHDPSTIIYELFPKNKYFMGTSIYDPGWINKVNIHICKVVRIPLC